MLMFLKVPKLFCQMMGTFLPFVLSILCPVCQQHIILPWEISLMTILPIVYFLYIPYLHKDKILAFPYLKHQTGSTALEESEISHTFQYYSWYIWCIQISYRHPNFGQNVSFCGVGAQDQNRKVERHTQTVWINSRGLLLHFSRTQPEIIWSSTKYNCC